jgi:hypothetical protein
MSKANKTYVDICVCRCLCVCMLGVGSEDCAWWWPINTRDGNGLFQKCLCLVERHSVRIADFLKLVAALT